MSGSRGDYKRYTEAICEDGKFKAIAEVSISEHK